MNDKYFTAPALIKKAKEVNETSLKIANYTRDRKIWKPNKIKFGPQVKRAFELIDSNAQSDK
jgi:hypothetical protein